MPLTAGLIPAGSYVAVWCAVPPAALTLWRPDGGLGAGAVFRVELPGVAGPAPGHGAT
ncbi:MAG: hypothetical protein IT433_00540 [Phycisphaerales bacterium]|nr:hypothetical protein [Phycisphaerales bacterium]